MSEADYCCPNCNNMDHFSVGSEESPYLQSFGQCLECGFEFETTHSYMKLENLNYLREREGLEVLTELPEQKEV